MEENVALDSSKQKKFVKSIIGIKKLIKKDEGKPENEKAIKPLSETKPKKNLRERGLVYLSHIPHGFYEHQMTQYFKQFGKVTNARVIRSKRTGRSKGFAFVEFGEPAVAQIVAETMNNYLMGKRLIKAAYVPPEKQRRHVLRKQWNEFHNPGAEARIKSKKAFNSIKTEAADLARARKILKNLNTNKQKLKELGIDYDFFKPVDVPEALANGAQDKPEKSEKKKVPEKTETKKGKQVEQAKKSKGNKEQDKKQTSAVKENKKVANGKEKSKKNIDGKELAKYVNVKEKKDQKLKSSGVKPPENFIRISEQKSDDDSDSSLEFDSDEFEKVQDFNDEFGSDDQISESDKSDGDSDEDDDDDGSNDSEEESSEAESVPSPPKRGPLRKQVKPQQMPVAKPNKQVEIKKKAPKSVPQPKPVAKSNDKKTNKQQEMKRKAPQKETVVQKKPKFEKKGKQKKAFKVKK